MVLKGPQTLVTDGERSYNNESGNEGMATAGAGDVLTGIIASFIGQKVEPFEAAKSGCYVHGMAGDIYIEEYAAASLIATDLIDCMDGFDTHHGSKWRYLLGLGGVDLVSHFGGASQSER